jgi:pimeloyl-ACP methyl ester carboxylesterase
MQVVEVNSMNTTADRLIVPGARLYYEVRGSGPVLLMIPGGPADGTVFTPAVPLLTDDYTVVTYDPRGIARSTLDDPTQDVPIEVQSDDAHRLLSAISTKPAYVCGSSGGAITGLALITQHADQVYTLVAHEPPLTELLPDRARFRAATDDIYDTYRRDGPGPAMQKFLATVQAFAGSVKDPGEANEGSPGAPDSETNVAPDQMQATIELFLGHMIRPITRYRPDAAALRAASTRVVVAFGQESTGQAAHRAAVALANLLGTTIVEFPGGHGPFMSHPDAFARTLHRVLTETT